MKPWFKSRTIWFNLLVVFTAGAMLSGYTPDTQVTETAVSLVAIANVILRFVTSQKIGKTP